MRTLTLTEDQFDVLYDVVEETIMDIQEQIDNTDLELNDYQLFHVWQQLNNPIPD
tara:strand:+ start:1786 stop:1950 length:165 start_codon:yes stop_codon:yes gene_type:complete